MVRVIFNLFLNSFRIRFGTELVPTDSLILILPIMLLFLFQLLVVAEGRINFYFSNILRSVYWILVVFDQFFVLFL